MGQYGASMKAKIMREGAPTTRAQRMPGEYRKKGREPGTLGLGATNGMQKKSGVSQERRNFTVSPDGLRGIHERRGPNYRAALSIPLTKE